jgi:hypothetical protein
MRASLDKDRDMARSILPSTDRRSARGAKAHVARARRAAVRQELRGVRHLADLDEWDRRFDLGRDTNREMRHVVQRRRSADKVNPFQRWAVVITRELRPLDRLPAMRGRLPRNLIGAHALSHLRWMPEFDPGDPPGNWRYRYRRAAQARHEAWMREGRRLERALDVVLESPDGHKTLNAAMKEVVGVEPERRVQPPKLVLDRRGVGALVAELYEPTKPNPLRHLEIAMVHWVADQFDPGWRCR